MAYQALYRRFRPRRFSEMAGQEHIVPVLKNQVELGRISHAYLFCGTRGTGKTSAAKIFARSINCASPKGGEACGECSSCADKDSVDVVEIDAASNNGVENIRDLREKARFTPLNAKYKVYIIDEAHMLSPGAFNALLKTLEEPPPHIVFILATTEPQKIPVTILSRCQRFDFHRISESDIAERLRYVLDETGVSYENEAVSTIARAADGGLRDALSVADQCLSFLSGGITLSGVLDMLGSMSPVFITNAISALIADDAGKLIAALEDVAAQGRDLLLFTRDFMMRLRAMLIIRTCGQSARKILGEPETFGEMAEQAGHFSPEKLLRCIALLQRAEADSKWLSPARPVLECAFIRLCRPEDETSLLALETRVAKLESGVVPKAAFSAPSQTPTPKAPAPSAVSTNAKNAANAHNAHNVYEPDYAPFSDDDAPFPDNDVPFADNDAPPWAVSTPVAHDAPVVPAVPTVPAAPVEPSAPKVELTPEDYIVPDEPYELLAVKDDPEYIALAANALFMQLLDALKRNSIAVYLLAKSAINAVIKDNVMTLEFPEECHARIESLNIPKNRDIIQNLLSKMDPALKIDFGRAGGGGPSKYDLMAKTLELFGPEVVQKI